VENIAIELVLLRLAVKASRTFLSLSFSLHSTVYEIGCDEESGKGCWGQSTSKNHWGFPNVKKCKIMEME
jgi:hypothetical protein